MRLICSDFIFTSSSVRNKLETFFSKKFICEIFLLFSATFKIKSIYVLVFLNC